jgi:hypothetical protein
LLHDYTGLFGENIGYSWRCSVVSLANILNFS